MAASFNAPLISIAQLLEASPDAVVVVDEVGSIQLANGRAADLFGFDQTLAGRRIEELIPETRPASNEPVRVIARRRDATPMAVDVWISPLGKATCPAAVITCRRPTFVDGAIPYQRMLDHVPDAIMAVDADGLIRFVNRRCQALFGYRAEELLGRSMDMLAPARSKDAPTGRQRVNFFARQPEGANLELLARRKDGSEIATDISLSRLMTSDGLFVLGAIRDVSGRKRLESERDAVEAMLLAEERGVERADFEMQLHQAQRLESIGRLAGGIAHDFNNLLGVIMMYTSFVSDGLDSDVEFTRDDIQAMQSDVAAVQEVAGRAAALTHKLLAFGRRKVVAPEVMDVNDVVRSMEDLLRRTIGENVDDLKAELAEGAILVKADRGQLDQVVMNLAVNASDAMPGGGTLTVTTAEVDIEGQRYARLTVSDSGVGMSREVAARAFDPFFTTKVAASGSGLGLATVYGIVKQAGGDVTIASTPGVGTSVTVLLPVTQEQLSIPRQHRELPDQIDGHETILLVEDEEMFQQPALRILTAHGYRVLAASNATEALAQAQEHGGDIHLLVTDIVMPGPSGQELARELLEARPQTRVLFMSGYGWEAFDPDGPSGSARLLDKPFAAQELLHSVRAALEAT